MLVFMISCDWLQIVVTCIVMFGGFVCFVENILTIILVFDWLSINEYISKEENPLKNVSV